MQNAVSHGRPWTFYALTLGFVLFLAFLYGPMMVIYILSFQGPEGGLTFPLRGVSTRWFRELIQNGRSGDIAGTFTRSVELAAVVAIITVLMCVSAGLGFRRRFPGSSIVFYLAIASLVMPGLFVGLGISLIFQLLGWQTDWRQSGLGAQLTWTLPFGLLVMFAVIGRFNRSYEEAARDLGATAWQGTREVTLPILLPGIIGVALFGFTLSYDEFARTVLTAGSEYPAAGDLGDDNECHLPNAVCSRHGHHACFVYRNRHRARVYSPYPTAAFTPRRRIARSRARHPGASH